MRWSLVLCLGVLAGCASNRSQVESKDLPAPVLSTLEHEAQGGKIEKITREVTSAGTTYDAQVTSVKGDHWNVKIDGAGRLVYKHMR